jgi:hypothetical protein
MESSLTLRKRSLINRLFIDQNGSYKIFQRPHRYSFSIYIKCALCILVLYYLNLLIGWRSYIWFEKSFEDEYHLTMTHIDVTKIEENPYEVLGSPKNIVSNRFLIENEYLCGRSLNPETRPFPHLLILVKSSCENFNSRQAIRLTWGEKSRLLRNNIRLAFVLGKSIFLYFSIFI